MSEDQPILAAFEAARNRYGEFGTRNLLKALLIALLEPLDNLRAAESQLDYTRRLALLEESKSLPWAAVWDYYCLAEGVPTGMKWFDLVMKYDKDVQRERVPSLERAASGAPVS